MNERLAPTSKDQSRDFVFGHTLSSALARTSDLGNVRKAAR